MDIEAAHNPQQVIYKIANIGKAKSILISYQNMPDEFDVFDFRQYNLGIFVSYNNSKAELNRLQNPIWVIRELITLQATSIHPIRFDQFEFPIDSNKEFVLIKIVNHITKQLNFANLKVKLRDAQSGSLYDARPATVL